METTLLLGAILLGVVFVVQCKCFVKGSDAMSQATQNRYIVTDDHTLGGGPIIRGTRTSVRAIVELWRQGIPPETIPAHLPHLTPAQVFDALSYYSDHQGEINVHIERNRIPDELIDPLVR
jgi:uncharacterized protein (DUF433 family)